MAKRRIRIRLADLPVFLLAALLLYWLSSCGGGSSGTGAFSSDPEKSRTLNTITDSEYSDLCQKVKDYSSTVLTMERLCTFDSIGLATFDANSTNTNSLQKTCEAALSTCLDETAGETQNDGYECNIDEQGTRSCGATFEELDQCLNDSFSAMESFFSTLTCAMAGDSSVQDSGFKLLTTQPDTESCRSLQSKCPELFRIRSQAVFRPVGN